MEWCDPKLIKLSDKDSTSEKASGSCILGSSEVEGACYTGGAANLECYTGGNGGN